ncbi:MAG: MucR family transcriptional regulator [Betaproteobacteria bacterium]|nr:MucR family transcriptional regulator [Betaproteobacteria bacterium]
MAQDRKFQSLEDVDAYLSGRKIECLLCGKKLFAMGLHLARKHGMTADEYKDEFGIPRCRGLIGVELAEQRGAQSAAFFASMSKDEKDRFLSAFQASRTSSTKTCDLPVFKNTLRKRVTKFNADAVDNRSKTTFVKCFYCGKQTAKTVYALRDESRRFRCDKCDKKLANESTNLSYYKHRDEYLKKQRMRDRERYAREKMVPVTVGIGRPRRGE